MAGYGIGSGGGGSGVESAAAQTSASWPRPSDDTAAGESRDICCRNYNFFPESRDLSRMLPRCKQTQGKGWGER
jgi:hypothetical protein